MEQKEELYTKERVEFTKQINDLKDSVLETKKTLMQDSSKYETEIAERNRLINQYKKDLHDARDKLEKDHTKLFGIIEGQDGEIKKLKNLIEQLKIDDQKALADIEAEQAANIDLKESCLALQAKTAKIEKLRQSMENLKLRMSDKEVWYQKQIDEKSKEISQSNEYITNLKQDFTDRQTRYIKQLWRIETNLLDGCYRFRNRDSDQSLFEKFLLEV